MDVFFGDAAFQELKLVGFGKIEDYVFGGRLVAWGHHIEPLQRVGFVAGAELVEEFAGIGKCGGELGGDFGADFVAAAADGGADGGDKIFRVAAELHLHLANGFGDDALEGAAPTGVNSGDYALFRIDDQDGSAVGGAHAEEKAGSSCGYSIAFALFGGRRVERADDIGMNLVKRDERKIIGADRGLEAALVFFDVGAGVPFDGAEIQNLLAVEIADAAGASAEAVD